MAYNEKLAEKVGKILSVFTKHEEKKMMGGLTFMVNDKMCVGILKDELMCRIDPEIHEEAIKTPGCRTMDFTKKPMKGFVFVSDEGLSSDKKITEWVKLAFDYNAIAKSSKKKVSAKSKNRTPIKKGKSATLKSGKKK